MGRDRLSWGNLWHSRAGGSSEGQGDSRKLREGCPDAGEVTLVETEIQQTGLGLYRTVFPLFCLCPRSLWLNPTSFLLN